MAERILPHPPRRESTPPEYLVESRNFPEYLTLHRPLVSARDISPHLDLKVFSGQIEKLANTKITGDVYSQQDQEIIVSQNHPPLTPTSPEAGEFLEAEQRRYESLSAAKGDLEIAQFIFQDQRSGSVFASSPVVGSHGQVNFDFSELSAQGYHPMLFEHKHPLNRILSPSDYLPVLISISDNHQYRMAKALLVICPDFQLLSVASTETLKPMEPAALKEFVLNYEQKIDTAVNSLDPEYQRVYTDLFSGWQQQMEEKIATLKDLESRHLSGDWSPDLELWLEKELSVFEVLEKQGFHLRKSPVYQEALRRHMKLVKEATDKQLLELAQVINMKQYVSFNYRDYEFYDMDRLSLLILGS